MKRILAGAVIALAIPVAIVAVLEVFQRPSPLTLLRVGYANSNADATGPVTMIWSVELYTAQMSMQGPSGAAAPIEIRLIDPEGRVILTRATRLLDPAVNIGVCPGHRPPKGAGWWSAEIPLALAEELRGRKALTYRFEAVIRTVWRPVVLVDSGCRGVGRG